MVDWVSLIFEGLFVGAGVLGGFYVDSILEKRNEKAQSIRILNLLLPELNANLVVMDILWRNLIQNHASYSHFNLDMWKGASNKIDLITNVELLTDLTAAYYNFEQFEKTIDIFNTHLALYISQSDPKLKAQVLRIVNRHRTVMLDRLAEPGDETNPTMPFRTRKAIDGVEQELKRLDC